MSAPGPALLRALIHPSAWNSNSQKFISKIVHSLTPLPLKTPAPGTLHSPAPILPVTSMDRSARSWMSFLQTNVCALERTPHAPSQMLQVAGRDYAELLRTLIRRSSKNSPSTHSVEWASLPCSKRRGCKKEVEHIAPANGATICPCLPVGWADPPEVIVVTKDGSSCVWWGAYHLRSLKNGS